MMLQGVLIGVHIKCLAAGIGLILVALIHSAGRRFAARDALLLLGKQRVDLLFLFPLPLQIQTL